MDLFRQIASELLKNSKEVSKLDETSIYNIWITMCMDRNEVLGADTGSVTFCNS